MVQCCTHVRRQLDCESGLPWHPAHNGTLLECLTSLSNSEGYISSPTHDFDANFSYITVPVRGLPIHFHSSLLPLASPSTLEPFQSFWSLVRSSGTPGDCLEFWNPRRPSGVSELHPIPFGLASPHFEAHHCTVPSHADSVYVFSCIPSKVSLEYSL